MPKGLVWLQKHQDSDGRWGAADFGRHCEGTCCDGAGVSGHDVGVSALALLAMMGRGNTHRVGREKKCVRKGLDWLLSKQGQDGSFGPKTTQSWAYDSVLATMAVCEAYALSRDYRFKEPAQRAVDYLVAAQNPGSGWRYEANSGGSDTSVTGWAVLALKTAKVAGLEIAPSAFEGALAWLDSVTDDNGKAGYLLPGDSGSAIEGVNDHFKPQPTMTAVSMICQIFCGRSRRDPRVRRGADILMENLPQWDSKNPGLVDMYYWYYGTYAMFQLGGSKWAEWRKAVKKALLEKQIAGGCADGSWRPEGKWGVVGGRIYATAINMLTLDIVERDERMRRHHGGGDTFAQNR